MQLRALLANRLAHVSILTMIVILLLITLRDLSPAIRTTVSILPILAWYFGLLYERALVLDNDLVDEDELKAAEREEATIFR